MKARGSRRRRLVMSLVVLALLNGCATHRGGPADAAGANPDSPATRVAFSGPVDLDGDRVELFEDGLQLAERLQRVVGSASQSVQAEIYEFDRPGLLDAMLAARARGVSVTVIADPSVLVNGPTLDSLRLAGAETALFPDGTRQIDHVKLLIVDHKLAFFGGMNWGRHSWRNRDFDLAIEGRAVRWLDHIFEADLLRAGHLGGLPDLAAESGKIRIATTYPGDEIEQAVLDLIRSASRSIFVEMYVMTDAQAMAALAAAVRRGVLVKTLFDPNQELNQAAAARLRAAGIKAHFYVSHGEKLHAKAMVVDAHILVVGSANWTRSGFTRNHELDAVVDSPELAGAALQRMESDWRQSAGPSDG